MIQKDVEGAHGFRSGYVALIGAPNVGKSTLLNQFLKQKISITAPKPQTTRNRILGILTEPGLQIVFLDTPGVHRARDKFNKLLVETALSTLSEVDVICFLVDATQAHGPIDEFILTNLAHLKTPVILAVNKIDLMRKKEELLPIMDRFEKRLKPHAVVPVSALRGEGVESLLEVVRKIMPAGPQYFPEEYLTDQPERFFVSELIREKVFRLTQQEVPYSVAVTVERFEELPERKRIDIDAAIHVERDSQKGIIIGKQGQMLKEIGRQARMEIETFLGCHVFLGLFVRVQKNWRKNSRMLMELGLYPHSRR